MSRGSSELLVIIFLCLLIFPAESSAAEGVRYDNTFRKDFIMDAPWRVTGVDTPIPLTIILKDCETDDIRELHWIRCWDVTTGETLIWGHDFNDERIGNDSAEEKFWTYITTVTENHPAWPDRTPLTPANLGYGAGETINLKVSIYYRDDLFNYTETRYLRVNVAQATYPWPAGWFGGDTHYHTMYTNNIAEFGAPLPAVVLAARAIDCDWLVTTDHSCDLDEMSDGSFSYRTNIWEYTIQGPVGTETVVQNNNTIGSTWDVLGEEVALWDSAAFRLYRGVEINLASIDIDSPEKTLHCLFYHDDYIHSPYSGAIGERPVTPGLPVGLSQLTGNGFAYAAHPLSDLSSEWGGIDWTVNGTRWGDEDLAAALLVGSWRGLQIFNTRETRYSSDQNNPWGDFDNGVLPDNPYPNELMEGVALWDALLQANLTSPPRKLFMSGGSDAHGDFNYASYMSLDNFATDNALGKVQTVVFVPECDTNGYDRSNLPPISELLEALKQGRSIVTDGPFVNIGLDFNDDGDFTDPDDALPGDDRTVPAAGPAPLTLRWRSTPDFGPVVLVRIFAANSDGSIEAFSLDPTTSGEGWLGERVIDSASFGFEGSYYFRAECLTNRGDDQFRAFTNPIWLTFEPFSHVDEIDADADETGLNVMRLGVRFNPTDSMVGVSYQLPLNEAATLTIYQADGRLIRKIDLDYQVTGKNELIWDACDESGHRVPGGVYLISLSSGKHRLSKRLVLMR